MLKGKFASDGIDLTPEQAAKAKAMVNSNIATGIIRLSGRSGLLWGG